MKLKKLQFMTVDEKLVELTIEETRELFKELKELFEPAPKVGFRKSWDEIPYVKPDEIIGPGIADRTFIPIDECPVYDIKCKDE